MRHHLLINVFRSPGRPVKTLQWNENGAEGDWQWNESVKVEKPSNRITLIKCFLRAWSRDSEGDSVPLRVDRNNSCEDCPLAGNPGWGGTTTPPQECNVQCEKRWWCLEPQGF